MIMTGECGVFNPLLLECLKEIQDQIRAHDVTPQENWNVDIFTGDRDSDPVIYNFFALCYNFLLRHINFIIENEEELQMEKKKKFQMPHTYIIIFGVILFAAILTMFIPLGKYETKEITYTMNGEE